MTQDNYSDDEKFALTPWGCLSSVLNDYGISYDHITHKMGEHMVEDFMDSMVKAGHIMKAEQEGKG